MPFFLIRGRYLPGLGIPDGDSVRFRADDKSLWKKLEGTPVRFGQGPKTKNTVQLRFEGIDAIEKKATEVLAKAARDNMFRLIGYDAKNNPEPRGYILTRMTDDKSGRPICFVFTGKPGHGGTADVYIDAQNAGSVTYNEHLTDSVNYKQMSDGYAYPLYYNTLFAAIRVKFNEALGKAKKARRGYWKSDATLKGVTIESASSLATIDPIWPKLWRRLQEYLRKHRSLTEFNKFLEDKNERVDILPEVEERGLQDIVEVTGKKVCLKVSPENLRVVGKAGGRTR
jgi:endonuclease YncB( thermonuclease family)